MSKLDQILEEALKKNEHNKREVKNPLTKGMIQYQKVLDNQNFSSQLNSQTTKKEIKQEYIVIDDESDEIPSQTKSQSTQNTQKKTKHIDILLRKQEEKNQIRKDLFKGNIIIFFMRTFELSEKRIKIFAEQIKQNQGEVYLSIQEYFEKYQTFYDLIQEKNTHILFICPDSAKVEEIRKQLQQYSLNLDIVINRVVFAEYLVETLKQKNYLKPDLFYISNTKLPETLNDVSLFGLLNYKIVFRGIQGEKNQKNQKSEDEGGLKKSMMQMQMVNEDSKPLSNGKISSDEDSIQDNNSIDLECLTNISKDILRQRKHQQEKQRKRIVKKARYLWDYNYDSDQEQDQNEDSEERESQNTAISVDSQFESKPVDYADSSVTPLKMEDNLFLSKVTEKEEVSANKLYFSSIKKLKRSHSGTQDDFLVSDLKSQDMIKLSKSDIKQEQNLILQINTNVSPNKNPIKQNPYLDYFSFDSDNEKEGQQKFEEYLQDEEDDFSDIDNRFITELAKPKNEDNTPLNILQQNNKNNTQLKGLKKINTPVEIVLSDGDEEDQQDFKVMQRDETNLDQNKLKAMSSNQDNPFKPFSGQIRRERYWDERKEHFVCASGAPKENLNKLITEELEKLLKIYQQEKDLGRSIAYRKAVSVIKSLDFQITSVKDVQKINGIGDKTKEKIKEILQTGQCQRAQILTQSERNQVIELLSKVWGIGPSTAASLYEKRIKTISDLRQNQHLLNKNQKIGLQYFEDLVERMPRDEATQIVDEVKKGFNELYPDDFDRYEIIACGSYRRGKETCGDVDILICRKDGEENKPKKLMIDLICKLEQKGLLVEHLQFPRPGTYGSETYMGIGKLQGGKHRRIDLKYYPKDLYGYALLYFTGSDYFNRSMRLFARKKGYSLSDHGLYAVSRIDNKNKVTSSLAIPCYTEEEVFQALNLEFKPPAMRSV